MRQAEKLVIALSEDRESPRRAAGTRERALAEARKRLAQFEEQPGLQRYCRGSCGRVRSGKPMDGGGSECRAGIDSGIVARLGSS